MLSRLIFSLTFLFFAAEGFADLAAPKEPTHLYLIRNGETPRNKEKKVQGQQESIPETQLNEDGMKDADKVGAFLKEKYPDLSPKFYTSPLWRAEETAKIAAQHFTNIRLIKKTDLQEISHGTHDGMDKDLRNKFCIQYYEREMAKIRAEYPDQNLDPYFKWKYNPLSGAESCYSLWLRTTQALKEIGEENPGEKIAVFTHGGVISTLITKAQFDEESGEVAPLYYEITCIPNCAVAHFCYFPDAKNEDEKLIFVGIE